jgi:hypothetical protein
MINLKPTILQALQNDAALISLLAGQHIYQLMAPNATEFPRIVFWEYDNIGGTYADDVEADSEVYIQIDIACRDQSTSAIAQEVDKVMKSIGFFRNASTDQYNDNNDTQIYEKHMRYFIFTQTN